LQRINVEERRLSRGLSTSLSIRIRSTSHRHNRGAGEQQNSVGAPLFGSLSKTASSVAREASPRSAAGSKRVLDPDLAPIARPLGGDLEAGLGCNAIGPQPPGQSVEHPAHALRLYFTKMRPARPRAPRKSYRPPGLSVGDRVFLDRAYVGISEDLGGSVVEDGFEVKSTAHPIVYIDKDRTCRCQVNRDPEDRYPRVLSERERCKPRRSAPECYW
jgi:hypothetical protein